jgi:hypothetical protein
LREYESKRRKLDEEQIYWLIPQKRMRRCPSCDQAHRQIRGVPVVLLPIDSAQAFLMADNGPVARIVGLGV